MGGFIEDEAEYLPSYETSPPEIVKSTPVWRMADPQVSPSIPTQADAAPSLPVGVGTVKVPVTAVKVP